MAEIRRVQVLENLLKANDYLAGQLRREWDEGQTFVVNLISSPGAGKTALLEATLPRLSDRYRLLVLVGDIETERDAQRIRSLQVEAMQITTGGSCHLESHMIEQALSLLREGPRPDFVFIENVGNLVCPAGYDLGEHLRAVLISLPEGDDKVLKYPKAFRNSQAMLITKADLLPHLDFSLQRVRDEALGLQPRLKHWVVSAHTGQGIDDWVRYLEEQRSEAFESGEARPAGNAKCE